MAVCRSGTKMTQIDKWPESSWRRLMEAVADPSRVWTLLPSCPVCGRNVAASDCEPDVRLCWKPVTGSCN